MDERKKELNELINYGNRLIDELSPADSEKATLLRGVLYHIYGIAQEYAEESPKNITRLESESIQEINVSLKKIKKAVKKLGKKNKK